MKSWEAQIPQNPKNKHVKRCYTIWRRWLHGAAVTRTGGKVVWLTDAELTLACIKYPNIEVDEVLERDRLEELKKYMHQTIE